MECNKNSLPSSGLQWPGGPVRGPLRGRLPVNMPDLQHSGDHSMVQASHVTAGCWENSSWESRIQRKRVTSSSHRHAVNMRWRPGCTQTQEKFNQQIVANSWFILRSHSHLMLKAHYCYTKMSRKSVLKGHCSHVILRVRPYLHHPAAFEFKDPRSVSWKVPPPPQLGFSAQHLWGAGAHAQCGPRYVGQSVSGAGAGRAIRSPGQVLGRGI